MSDLYYGDSGSGKVLVILHGLFGSHKNWQSHARRFAEFARVIAIDLRNHGSSFHADEMNYDLMAADVAQTLEQLNLSRCDILGHSMGGKVAIKLALNHAELVDRLVIADIAPVSYEHDYDHLIDPILALSLSNLESRKQADQLLKPDIGDDLLRAFLLQNLVQEGEQWRWRVNWTAIKDQLPELTGFALSSQQWCVDAPTLFINGGKSPYIGKLEQEVIKAHFSEVEFATIPSAGHWLHTEKPAEFSRLVVDYLS